MLATTIAIFNASPNHQRRAWRFVLSSFVDAVMIWLVLEVLALYTLHHIALGERYIFAPHGLGILMDAAIHIVLFTGFFVCYCVPSYMVRPWLGWILRVLMFGIFVAFLTFMAMVKVIAIVQTPDHRTIFYPRYPFAPQTYTSVPGAVIRRNSAVSSIRFANDDPEGLTLYPVYSVDTAGQTEIERLRAHIQVMTRNDD